MGGVEFEAGLVEWDGMGWPGDEYTLMLMVPSSDVGPLLVCSNKDGFLNCRTETGDDCISIKVYFSRF
jgi:hypothetical protein